MKTISIFGVPRSGTSWLGQLFNSSPNVAYRYQPLFSYAFKDYLNINSNSEHIEKFHTELLKSNDPFLLQIKNVSGKTEVYFEKDEITHLVWKEVRYLNLIENLLLKSNIKIIGIIRNPFAVMNSWFNAPKEFDSSWNKESELMLAEKKNASHEENFYGLYKWIETYKNFEILSKKYPERLIITYYEDLVNSIDSELKKLFEFAKLDFGQQTVDFIHLSTSKDTKDPYSVIKLKENLNEWKFQLDKKIVNLIQNELANNDIHYP